MRPFVDHKFKLNTYIVESSFRNHTIDSLWDWLFLRAIDVSRNGEATGRIYGIKSVIRELSRKINRSLDRTKRRIAAAEQNGYCIIDTNRDVIFIPSKMRLTKMLIMQDECGLDRLDRPLPLKKFIGPDSIMEVSVSLNEIWDSKHESKRQSNILDIIRQRISDLGLSRESLSKLVGMERTSTARIDRTNNVERTYQYAAILIKDIVYSRQLDHNKIANDIVEWYRQYAHCLPGHGQKLWAQQYHGHPAIMTQLGVKWDTKFKGRLAFDVSISKALKSSAESVVKGCRAPQSRDSLVGRGIGLMMFDAMSNGLRQSLVTTVTKSLTSMAVPHRRDPIVRVVDDVAPSTST